MSRKRNRSYQEPVENFEEQEMNPGEENYDEYYPEDGDNEEPEDEQETEEEKPSKLKAFFRGVWKWTKRLAPLGLAFGAGYATKTFLGKSGGVIDRKATEVPAIQGTDTPALPVTETVALPDGSKAEVTEF